MRVSSPKLNDRETQGPLGYCQVCIPRENIGGDQTSISAERSFEAYHGDRFGPDR